MKKTLGMKRRRWNLGPPSCLDRSIFYFFHCAILCCMEKALLLSSGMDSTTLLWWTRARGDDVHAISIDYNQRHKVELQWATALASQLNIPHKTISLDLSTIGGSPLTDRALDVPSYATKKRILSTKVDVWPVVAATPAQSGLPLYGTIACVINSNTRWTLRGSCLTCLWRTRSLAT